MPFCSFYLLLLYLAVMFSFYFTLFTPPTHFHFLKLFMFSFYSSIICFHFLFLLSSSLSNFRYFFFSFFLSFFPLYTAEFTDSISVGGSYSPNECQGYDTKQSDDEAPIMLELWGMRCTTLLPIYPLRPGVVAPDKVLSKGQIKLNSVLMLNCIVWNRTFFYI